MPITEHLGAAMAVFPYQCRLCGAQPVPIHSHAPFVSAGCAECRCQCKHKAVEHDPVTRRCMRSGCPCTASGFVSPFVCNCNHRWTKHQQQMSFSRSRGCTAVSEMAAVAMGVNDYDRLQRDPLRGCVPLGTDSSVQPRGGPTAPLAPPRGRVEEAGAPGATVQELPCDSEEEGLPTNSLPRDSASP
eukprot:GHVU01069730.1.p1 GENE.GHVU01069730.1~~GHVU01069730.1.p1  ORF type:complete len:187 (-),score=5.71 GHVU01069730.1:231-791(-)